MVDWNRVYRLLNDVTPLSVDCGRLCRSACCTEWEKGAGIFLLPGEESMFSGSEPWLAWEERTQGESGFCPGTEMKFYFVTCRGVCPRGKRPFACRTFPVAPYLTPDEKLELLLDEAGMFICPLVKAGDINMLSWRFLARARLAWDALLQEPLIKEYVTWKSRLFEKTHQDIWRKLLD